jgi:hypothetical protein
MTRRLRIAGTALGAILVPACASYQQPADTHRVPPPVVGQSLPDKPIFTSVAKASRPTDAFATERSDSTPDVVIQPTPPPESSTAPKPLAPIEHRTDEVAMQSPSLPPRWTPRGEGAEKASPVAEPVPDAEGVVRAPWPVIKGTLPLVEPPNPPSADPGPLLLPTGDFLKTKPDESPAILAPAPKIAPPSLPPGVIGSSVHETHASPVAGAAGTEIAPPAEPFLPPPETLIGNEKVISTSGGSGLLEAVRAFQQNKPDEAVDHLKSFDPATQQVLLSLIPALVRLSEGKLSQMKPEEMDVLLEQLTRVPSMLRPRASLKAENVRLCREVLNFGHVEPFAEKHTFRPGDIIYLYMELANFSCVSDPTGGYSITMTSALEIKNTADVVVWRADPKEMPDRVSSPPQDYYRNFRLCVPTVPPGTYTLSARTIDRPTGREVVKTIELLIGSK